MVTDRQRLKEAAKAKADWNSEEETVRQVPTLLCLLTTPLYSPTDVSGAG